MHKDNSTQQLSRCECTIEIALITDNILDSSSWRDIDSRGDTLYLFLSERMEI
jgi:hypothetical protein